MAFYKRTFIKCHKSVFKGKITNMKYICYYRVSTKVQGKSGLGLSDQKQIVERFINDSDEIILEFTELESGRKNERPKLQEAIRECQRIKAKLVEI